MFSVQATVINSSSVRPQQITYFLFYFLLYSQNQSWKYSVWVTGCAGPRTIFAEYRAGIANCAFLLQGCFNVQSMFKANWDQGNITSPHVLGGCTTSRHVSFLRSFQKSDSQQTKTKLRVPGNETTPNQISQDSFHKCNYLLFQVKHPYINSTNLGTGCR